MCDFYPNNFCFHIYFGWMIALGARKTHIVRNKLRFTGNSQFWRGDGRVKRPADSFNPFIRLETLIGSAVAPALPTHCLHDYWLHITHAHPLYEVTHWQCHVPLFNTSGAIVPVPVKQAGQYRVVWLCGRNVAPHPIIITHSMLVASRELALCSYFYCVFDGLL